jgi:hypothetical protein
MKFARGVENPGYNGMHCCTERTRTEILEEIDLWSRDFKMPPVYWLSGLAGTGKSTIAQTVVGQRKGKNQQIGAYFFCSRESVENSNPNLIIPTLAYLLASRYRPFLLLYIPLLLSNPRIIEEPLREQMKKLVIEPLKASGISTVIVIDGLDECKEKESVSVMLSALGEFLPQIPKVKFLITSRPERHVRAGFLGLPKVTCDLREFEQRQVQDDILLFFEHEFLENWFNRGAPPSGEDLVRLCKHAGGLFPYAAAAVRFIRDHHFGRLSRLLESPMSVVLKVKVRGTTICSRYTSTLLEAFGDYKPDDAQIFRSVLGAIVLAVNPLSPSAVATLLELNVEHVMLCLQSVESLLIPWENKDSPVQPFHETFPAFLTDPDMCTDKRFHVSPRTHHKELLVGCLKLMNEKLGEIPSDIVTNSGVDVRTVQAIDDALKYACMSWHKHLAGTEPEDITSAIIEDLGSFLDKMAIWKGVLDDLGTAETAADGQETLVEWLARLETVSSVLGLPQHLVRTHQDYIG